jgi:hypothetical protein
MAAVNKRIRKKRGRPATGQDPVVAVRLSRALIKEIDGWGARQDEVTSTRSEAVRRLVEIGLAASQQPRRGRTGPGREKSAKIAGKTIDALADQSVPVEERAKRKRRLLKGPNEFREIRDDQPEARGPRR